MSRDLKIVSAAMLTWGLGEGMFFIFQPLYIQELGANPILIGSILGVTGLVMAVAQIPSGYLADRIGRQPLMRFSWVSGVVATWVMALAPSLPFFVIGLLLYGLTSSVMAPLNTYIQGARGNWTVGKAVSFVSASYNIGGIIGPMIGGLVGEMYNLRTVYFVAGGIFIISTMILFIADKQPVVAGSIKAGESSLLRNKTFIGMLGLVFVVMVATTMPQPLAANFLQNQRGLNLNQIGQLGSLGALGSVLLMLIFGYWQVGTALVVGQVGLVLFALLLWQGGSFLWYGLGYLFLGGYRLCRAMTVALVRPVVRDHEVGLAFGLVEFLNSMAFVIAPIIAGFLYDWRPVSIFQVGLLALLISLVFSLYYLHRGKSKSFNKTLS